MVKPKPSFSPERLEPAVLLEHATSYMEALVELLDDEKIRQHSHAAVPREADDYLGSERAVMAEKTMLISELVTRVVNRPATELTEPADMEALQTKAFEKKPLDATVSRLVSSSSNPPYAMSIIARIWQYLEKNKNSSEMTPADFQCFLEQYAEDRGIKPLSFAEASILLKAFKKWKAGEKPEEIIGGIEALARGTLTQSKKEREVDDDREKRAVQKRHQELLRIRDYFAKKTGILLTR